MTEEKRTLSEFAKEQLVRAKDEYAPIVDNPLSPTGKGVELRKDFPLLGRESEDGKQLAVPAGSYMLFSDGSLGYVSSFSIVDGNGETIASSNTDGFLEGGDVDLETVVREDGTKETVIKSEVQVALKRELLKTNDRVVTALEIWANIAYLTADSQEDSDRLLSELFKKSEPTGDGTELIQLPQQDVFPVRYRTDPTTKLSKTMTDPDRVKMLYEDSGAWLDVAGANEKKSGITVDTFVALEYTGDGYELSKQMTPYDSEVHNSVISVYNAGNRVITPQQVYETMTGAKAKHREQLEQVEDSLDKQRKTFVTLDYTQEARGRELTDSDGNPVTEFSHETYMLNADKVNIRTAKGSETTGYVINKKPVLYTYAEALGQVATYPTRYLDTKRAGTNTEQNVLVRNYLSRRIEEIANPKSKLSNHITYKSIFEYAGVTSEETKKDKRRYIAKLLDLWREQGRFKSWSEYYPRKQGRGRPRAEGVEIKGIHSRK